MARRQRVDVWDRPILPDALQPVRTSKRADGRNLFTLDDIKPAAGTRSARPTQEGGAAGVAVLTPEPDYRYRLAIVREDTGEIVRTRRASSRLRRDPEPQPRAPLSNTGAQNTQGNGEAVEPKESPCTAMIDYLGVTYRGDDALELAKLRFGAGLDWVATDKGGYYYRQSIRRADVTVYYDHMTEQGAGTVFVVAKGMGCRQLEHEGLIGGTLALDGAVTPWQAFLAEILEDGGRFARLDVAIDGTSETIPVLKVRESVAAGLCVSRFRTIEEHSPRKLATGELTGDGLTMGHRGSLMFVRLYHKGLEQVSKGLAEQVVDWWRWEMEAHDERAQALAKKLVRYGLTGAAMVLWTYVDFKDSDSQDSNLSRRDSAKWWTDWLDACQKLRLTELPEIRTLYRTMKWVVEQVAPALHLLVHGFSEGWAGLQTLINDAGARLGPQHFALLAGVQPGETFQYAYYRTCAFGDAVGNGGAQRRLS